MAWDRSFGRISQTSEFSYRFSVLGGGATIEILSVGSTTVIMGRSTARDFCWALKQRRCFNCQINGVVITASWDNSGAMISTMSVVGGDLLSEAYYLENDDIENLTNMMSAAG